MNDQETPQRLKMRSFLKNSIWGLFSVESGFFYTAIRLAVKPWAVVRDYIHGDRDRYMAPVNMLVALLVYITLFSTLFDIDSHTFDVSFHLVYESDDADPNSVGYKLIQLLFRAISSHEFTYALMCPPIMLAVWLTYCRFGGRRFNAAEYLVATLYMLCTFLEYDFLHLLLTFLGINLEGTEVLVPIVLGYIALVRAFKVRNFFVRVALLILCTVLMVLFCGLLFVGIMECIGISSHSCEVSV
jgi:succinate dehydrogenase hydrophobic anchor subunit